MSIITDAETVVEAATGTGWIKLALPIAAVLALLVWLWAIYHHGERAGATRVAVKVERQHTARVAEARTDEHSAGAAASSIAAHTIAADVKTDALVQAEIKDLRHALDAVPPAAPGGALPAAPVVVLAASINAGVDRANRAADAADAAGGAGKTGAP